MTQKVTIEFDDKQIDEEVRNTFKTNVYSYIQDLSYTRNAQTGHNELQDYIRAATEEILSNKATMKALAKKTAKGIIEQEMRYKISKKLLKELTGPQLKALLK